MADAPVPVDRATWLKINDLVDQLNATVDGVVVPPPDTPPPTTPPTPTNPYPDRGSVGAKNLAQLPRNKPTSGFIRVDKPTTIADTYLQGGLDVYSDLTLRNVMVEQSGAWWGNIVLRAGASLTAEDVTIKPTNTSPNEARRQDGVLQMDGAGPVTLRRVDCSYAGKLCLGAHDVLIEDSWVHAMTPYTPPGGSPTHKGAFMSMGGAGHIILRRSRLEVCNIKPYNATTNPEGFDPATQTGCILLQPWSNITDVLVELCFMMGGYYSLRAEGTQPSRNINGVVSKLKVRNNVFCPMPGGGPVLIAPGVGIDEWTGNVQGDENGVPNTTAVPKPA